MKLFLWTCVLLAAIASAAYAAEPMSYAPSTFTWPASDGPSRAVKPLDDPANPFRDQYTLLDKWIYRNAHTIEEARLRTPSNDMPMAAYVDRDGYMLPIEQSAERIMYVRYNTALVGEHEPFSSGYYQLVAYGDMDDATRQVREEMNMRLRSQYTPQFPDWLLAMANDSFTLKLDESKQYPGNPTDWKSWMEFRGAEKQPDGQWKVWSLESAVPLSDGTWVVTTLKQSPNYGGEPLRQRGAVQPNAGVMRVVIPPFPNQVFGEAPNTYTYSYYDEWRNADGTVRTPEQQNSSSEWNGMFQGFNGAYQDDDPELQRGLVNWGEYMSKSGRDGSPQVIYQLHKGKVYDSREPALQSLITLSGMAYGHEIRRGDMLKLQAYRDSVSAKP